MKKTLTTLGLAASLVITAVPFASSATAGCASYPGATVVKCVRDTPKPEPTKAQKKRLSLVNRHVARVNLDVDHPVREPNLPKRAKR